MKLFLRLVLACALLGATVLAGEEEFKPSSWTLNPRRATPRPHEVLVRDAQTFHPLHKMETTGRADTFAQGERASLSAEHEVLIAVTQPNLDVLDIKLQERSTPGHPLYRQWLSFEEVGEVVANPKGVEAVKSWLENSGVHIAWISPRQEYIRAKAPIEVWNRVLQTEFFEFHDSHPSSSLLLKRQLRAAEAAVPKKVTVFRAQQVYVPEHVSEHVGCIFQTTQAPAVLQSRPKLRTAEQRRRLEDDSTPMLLDLIPDFSERVEAYTAFLEGNGPRPEPVVVDREKQRRHLEARESASARQNLEPMQPTLRGGVAASASLSTPMTAQTFSASLQTAGVVTTWQTTCDESNGSGSYCVTPGLLKEIYNMTVGGVQSQLTSQSVFATLGQTYSIKDSETFNIKFNTSAGGGWKAKALNGNELTGICTGDLNNCAEANLDMQYIMGIASNAKTYFNYVPHDADSSNAKTYFNYVPHDADYDVFILWIYAVVNGKETPDVHSISYGALEYAMNEAVMYYFTIEALKLAVRGVTIVAASGDHGAAGVAMSTKTNQDACLCNVDSSSSAYLSNTATWSKSLTNQTWTGKGYFPMFPASCPYVTAVGGTSNFPTLASSVCASSSSLCSKTTMVISNTTNGVKKTYTFKRQFIKDKYRRLEVMADTKYSTSSITSGGGFSAYWDRPSWQSTRVSTYINSVGNNNIPLGFNEKGRGYPDVSMAANNFEVIIGGTAQFLDGTSASAPTFAAMITLLNAMLLKHGSPKVGFVNPTLYAADLSLFTDIDQSLYSHINNCCGLLNGDTKPTCCTTSHSFPEMGFPALAGWDAATGLGSVSYTRLFRMLNPAGTWSPTNAPTFRPSNPSPVPTKKPTVAPTFYTETSYVAVTQRLSGLSLSTLSTMTPTASAATTKTIKQTVAAMLPGINSGCVTIEKACDSDSGVCWPKSRWLREGESEVEGEGGGLASVGGAPLVAYTRHEPPVPLAWQPSEASARPAGRDRALGSSTDQIDLKYVIFANVSGVDQSFVLTRLASAASDGSFATTLSYYASTNFALALVGVTPVVGVLSTEARTPTFQPTVSSATIGELPIIIVSAVVGGFLVSVLVVAMLYRFGYIDRWMGTKGTHTHNVCGLASDVSEEVVRGKVIITKVPHPHDADYDFDAGGNGQDPEAWADSDASSSAESSAFGVEMYGSPQAQAQAQKDAAIAASRAAGWRVPTDRGLAARSSLLPGGATRPALGTGSASSRVSPSASGVGSGSDSIAATAAATAPAEFLCPLTMQLMTDPQIAADGNSYERANIVAYFAQGHKTSPVNGQPLKHLNLWPNAQLKGGIDRHLQKVRALVTHKQEKEVGILGYEDH